jgi:hypothetical protein
MSDDHLNRVLYERAREHKMAEAIGPDEVAGYDLTSDERAALAAGDVDALHWVLDTIADGRGEELAGLTWEQIERDGGSGGQEIRNWISVLAAVPGVKGEVLAYEPVKEWLTGCGAVWMQV